jgi:tetratricopeptide (TPR) repeat protein
MILRTIASVSLCLLVSACASGPDPSAAAGYVGEGREAAKRGDHEGAIGHYTRAIEADPQSAEAYFERGYSNVRLRLDANAPGAGREYEDNALVDFSRAIQLNQTIGDAYYNRAMLYSSRASYRQAAEDLLSVVRLKPQDPEPHFAIAQLYEQKFEDMIPQAMDHYEKYVDLGGRDRDAREKARQWKELKKANAAIPKAPTDEDEKKAQELHVQAMALMKDEKPVEALKVFEQLLSSYGRTGYVQGRLPGFKLIMESLKAKAPK